MTDSPNLPTLAPSGSPTHVRRVRWLGLWRASPEAGELKCANLTCDNLSAGRQKYEYVDEDGMRESRRTRGYSWPCITHAKPKGQIEEM